MLDDKLKEELIKHGKEAVMSALPDTIKTESGFVVPVDPLASAVLDAAVIGLEALIAALELKRVDVVGGEDTEIVLKIRD